MLLLAIYLHTEAFQYSLRHCAPFFKNYTQYCSHIQKPTFQEMNFIKDTGRRSCPKQFHYSSIGNTRTAEEK